MPNPKNYKNTEKDYKRYMNDCMHQTRHMERKKKPQSIAQCLNMWRGVHGPKHPGKGKKKVADFVTLIAEKIRTAAIITEIDAMATEIESVHPVLAYVLDRTADKVEAYHYKKFHHGDPQYEEPDHVKFTLPKNFYALQIVDADGEEIDTLSFRNDIDSEERNEEDNASPVKAWVDFILKDLPAVSKWALETVEKKRKDPDAVESYKEPWHFLILRGEDDQLDKEQKEVSSLKSEPDISNWLKDTITKDFSKYYEDEDNWKTIEPSDDR